mgnify:CR=1 FL=1
MLLAAQRKRTPPAVLLVWMTVLPANFLVIGAGRLAGKEYQGTGRGLTIPDIATGDMPVYLNSERGRACGVPRIEE